MGAGEGTGQVVSATSLFCRCTIAGRPDAGCRLKVGIFRCAAYGVARGSSGVFGGSTSDIRPYLLVV